jgi:hypothetical protein
MRQCMARIVSVVCFSALCAGCTHTARLDPSTLQAPVARPMRQNSVGIFIAPEIASHVDQTSVRTGVWNQSVTVDSGPTIARALDLVTRSTFRTVTTVSQAQPSAAQDLLEFRFEGMPTLTCAWNAGLIMVGSQCVYTLPLKARLVTGEGRVRWTDTVVVTGRSDSEQPLGNLPDASDFSPAIDDAIQSLMTELNARFRSIPET